LRKDDPIIDLFFQGCRGSDTANKLTWPGFVSDIQASCMTNGNRQKTIKISWKPPRNRQNTTITGYEIIYMGSHQTYMYCQYTNSETTTYLLKPTNIIGPKVFIAVVARPSYNGLRTIMRSVDKCSIKNTVIEQL